MIAVSLLGSCKYQHAIVMYVYSSFAGDKVTSYGGYLRYTLKNVPSSTDPRYRNTAADVQLISVSSLTKF